MQQVYKPLICFTPPRSTTRTLAIKKKTNSTSGYFFKKKYHAHDFNLAISEILCLRIQTTKLLYRGPKKVINKFNNVLRHSEGYWQSRFVEDNQFCLYLHIYISIYLSLFQV